MPKCEQCGKEVDLPFKCKFCGGYFCLEHRLPEGHNCQNLPPRTPLGGWQTKKEMVIARAKETTDKFASEGDYHFTKETSKSEKPEVKKAFPTKKVVGVSLAIIIVGALILCAPIIISYISEASYTKLTLVKSSMGNPNCTLLTFGDLEYCFTYSWNGLLAVSNSLLEVKTYNPAKGSVYVDIGVETKISEVQSDYIVILVKPNPPDYLAKSSFKKLVIAVGQYQTINFSGNEYWLGYFKNPPYYYRTLVISTPLLETREYQVSNSQTITSDLGLEIRVYKATDEFVIIFVKAIY